MRNGKRILNVTIRWLADTDSDTSYLEQKGWEARLAEYRNGDFSYVGVRADAEVQLTLYGPIQKLTSGGLWGIESDSQDSYLQTVEREELADLKTTLIAAGFSRRAVSLACKSPERRSEV